MTRICIIVALASGTARADGPAPSIAAGADEPAKPDDIELRLTLSTFLFRESGADAPAIVDQGAMLQNASPVRRYFGDLRGELATDGFALDVRVRQTTSARYQAGASAGGEYEIRTLDYKLGSARTQLTLGRQYIDAVGATHVDGLAVTQRLGASLTATVFGGAFPELGSRSLDTDYVHVRNADGTEGSLIVPLTGGLGVAYQLPDYHGDLGAAAVYVPQDVPGATSSEKSRVFATSSGYSRISAPVDVYHFALLDVAGGSGVNLTNGSLGVDARPTDAITLTGAINHVSTDLLQIAARNLLTDPDPSAIGVVQNNIAVIRVSQDIARATASVAMAEQRFQLSLTGAYHRRPAVSVQLADGSGAVVFPEASSADTTLTVLDRHSIADLRMSLSGSLVYPIGSSSTNRARGSLVRLSASRTFAQQRGQIEADVMGERFRDVDASNGMCMSSLDIFACYGTSSTTAAQAGALASWRIGREWLLLADLHVGYRDVHSTSIAGAVAWPSVTSITSFIRMQWRYR